MKNRRKYKLQAGIQSITPDTPDYSKAYAFKAEQGAKNKGISQAAGMFSGAYAPIGQVGGMGADVIRNRAKNKKSGATLGGAVEMGTSGAALGAQLGGPWGAAAGAVIGGTYGAIKGAKDYEKTKALAKIEEEKTKEINYNKFFHEGASTDAQSFVGYADKGKYKLKTKQPRLIETEGREPIFSPKKADGTRDLLYYNPNDPTHEEGGVKAIVMPKAQLGRQSTKAQSSSTSVARPIAPKINKKFKTVLEEENKALKQDIGNKDKSLKNYKKVYKKRQNFLNVEKEKSNLRSELDDYKKGMSPFKKWEDVNYNSFNDFLETSFGRQKDMSPAERENITRKALEEWKKKNPQEDPLEDAVEIFDRYGVTSWDDVRRKQIENQRNLNSDPNATPDVAGNLFELASAAPGGKYIPFRQTAGAAKSLFGKSKKALEIGEKVFTPTIGTLNKIKKYGKQYSQKGLDLMDELSDYANLEQIYNNLTNSNKAYGAKQLKVNDLNNTALSNHLANTPPANAANTFLQPQAGINQVARQIPQERRQEKIRTPRSHKTAPKDSNRIIDPPMLYEMKPPPPKSTFNTKNDFNKGSKKVKVYK